MAIVGTGLPVNRLIEASWSISAQPGVTPNINACLIIGPSPVINPTERIRQYLNIAEVAVDFGVTTPEYQSAVLWFSQSPQPQSLYIGRWVQTASHGQLIGGTLSPAQQLIASWAAIANGGVVFTIDGVVRNLSGMNFSSVTNLNAVASIITSAIGGSGTMVWNANYGRFELTSASTGITSSVSFATPGTGTDISSMLVMTAAQASAGAGDYAVQGMAPETAVSAVVTFDNRFSQLWYGLIMPTAVDLDHQAVAAYIEAANPPHYYGVTTQEAGVLSPVDQADIAYVLMTFGYNKTAVQYSSNSVYAVASYMARALTVDWTGSNTAIILMYKQEPGVIPEVLNNTQANAAQAKNCNVYVDYANGTQLIEYGTSASGQFTDTVVGADALSVQAQANYFNTLYTTQTKIPQTDAGMTVLMNAVGTAGEQFNRNGYLAPGPWNDQPIGTLSTGQLVQNGYYLYALPIALQPEAQREQRIAPVIQMACKLAGGIQTGSVLISINP